MEPRLSKQAFSFVPANTSTVASCRRDLLVRIVSSPLPEGKLRNRLTDLHDASCVSEDGLQNGMTRIDCSHTQAPAWVVGAEPAVGASKARPSWNKQGTQTRMVHGVQQEFEELSLAPKILCRVVCGFGETMDTSEEQRHTENEKTKDPQPAMNHFAFAPTSALTKEDFPEFGTPRTAIWPLRSS